MIYNSTDILITYPRDGWTSGGVTSTGGTDMRILTPKVSGIYAIVNIHNGHRYIGSAVNLHSRWLRHKNELRRGIHRNRHLQHAWNKYGEDAFNFVVLENVKDKQNLIPIEQGYVSRMRPEYNISIIVDSPMMGRKHREESKKKISNSHIGIRPTDAVRHLLSVVHKGLKASVETRQKMSDTTKGMYRGWADRAILQYTKDGRFVNRFKSIMDAERATGIGNGVIVRCARGGRPTAGGFIWRYAEEK